MFIGYIIISITLTGLGVFTITDNSVGEVTCILIFVLTYYLTAGPVTWIYMGEIMYDKGLAIAICINWIFTLAVALGLPFIADALKENQNYYGYIWITCGALCFSAIFFMKLNMKETQGLSLKEIENLFKPVPKEVKQKSSTFSQFEIKQFRSQRFADVDLSTREVYKLGPFNHKDKTDRTAASFGNALTNQDSSQKAHCNLDNNSIDTSKGPISFTELRRTEFHKNFV